MHLVPINLVEILLRLWTGNYQFDQEQPCSYVLTKEQWIEIGNDLENARAHLPDAFGPAPLNIYTRLKAYKRKAIQKHNLLLLYFPTIMRSRLPAKYYQNLIFLCKAYSLTMSRVVTEETLTLIKELWARFVLTFEELYVHPENQDEDPRRQVLMTSNIHATLHIADTIRDLGPAYGWCEWGLEDFLGPLRRMARSKVFVDESAMQAVWAKELIKLADMGRRDFVLGNLWSFNNLEGTPKEGYEIETGIFYLPNN